MIKVYIQCDACGFKGITYENEDLDEDMEDLEEQEECPQCGEFAKEIDDDKDIQQMDSLEQENLKRREERRGGVTPFSLGDQNDGD